MENSLDEKLGKTKFGVFDSALACLLFIIYNFIFVEIYRLIPHSSAITFVAQFLVEFLFGVAAFTAAKARKYRFFEATGATKKISGKLVGLAFVISIVCLFFFGNLTDAFLEILYACGFKSQLGSIEVNAFWELLVYTLVSCITPAVCEEILFRGTILSGLKSFGIKVAVVVSAVIFTLMHGQPEQTMHQFVIGLIIGLIFFKTGNLWIGVIVHFFNNFIAIAMAYVLGLINRSGILGTATEEAATGTLVATPLNIVLDIFFAISFAAVGFVIVRILIRKVISENERINGTKEVGELQGATTINVDGNEVVTTMTIDGEQIENQDEMSANEGEQKVGKEKSQVMSLPTILLFVLSGLYLVGNWIIALVAGFL